MRGKNEFYLVHTAGAETNPSLDDYGRVTRPDRGTRPVRIGRLWVTPTLPYTGSIWEVGVTG